VPGLAAGLDEVSRLVRTGDVDRAVVGDDAERAAFDRRMAADRRAAVRRAEFEEVGVVDEAGDRLAHVDRALQIGRHQAEQLFRIEARWPVRPDRRRTPHRAASRGARRSPRAMRSASRSSSAR
jgi:hypothetical protein